MGSNDDETGFHILLVVSFVSFYALLSSFLSSRRIPLHRTSVAIIIGMICGIVIKLSSPKSYAKIVHLNETIVFSVLLPPILFAEGYSVHKKAVSGNMGSIILFGILGTILSFILNCGLLSVANDLHLVRDMNDIHNYRVLSIWEILLFGACLCSIDTLAAEENISQQVQPNLHAVVFGQGIMKDTVTIILFRSILSLQQRESPQTLVIYWYTFFKMLLSFLILISSSFAIGIVFGTLTSYLLKKCRFILKDQGVSETILLFTIGILSYLLSQSLDMSGALTILSYGLILNRYNSHNMSKRGAPCAQNTFLVLSRVAEGLLFLVMGVMLWQGEWQNPKDKNDKMTHSYIFCAVVLVVLSVGRVLNVYVLGVAKAIATQKKMQWQQMHVLFVGGMVRGAIPFALFTSIEFTNTTAYAKNQGIVLKSTIILVIIFTSVLLNSIIPLAFNKLLLTLPPSTPSPPAKGKIYSLLSLLQSKYIKPLLIYHHTHHQPNHNQSLLSQEKIQQQEREE